MGPTAVRLLERATDGGYVVSTVARPYRGAREVMLDQEDGGFGCLRVGARTGRVLTLAMYDRRGERIGRQVEGAVEARRLLARVIGGEAR